MKLFVVGATGFVGSHVVSRFVAAGHDVTGLARSESRAGIVRAAGATAVLGDVADLDALSRRAVDADATVFAPQLHQEDEHRAVDALLAALSGSGKTFIFTSGTGVLSQRTNGEWSEDSFAEDDPFVPCKYLLTRRRTELAVRAAALDGVRGMVVRPPLIWGNGMHGFVDAYTEAVEKTGAACYVGRGLNLYTHVHVEDLARLYLAVAERGEAGALYHAVAGEVNNRTLAEWVAKRHGVETRSVTPSEAVEIWDKFRMLVVLGTSSRSRSPRSRDELGWVPEHVDVLEDLRSGVLDVRGHGSRADGNVWNGGPVLAS